VTEADKKKQAATLAEIAKLPEGTTVEEYNRLRLMAHIIIPDDESTVH
jgi:hypothetical protein